MPEKIRTLYGSLLDEGYDLPNYDQFLKDMSDNNNRTKFHASLVEEGYELPDYKTFSLDMGFDEKKKGFQTDLGKAYETTSGGSFPKYQGMRLEGSTPMTKKVAKQPSSPLNVDKGVFQQTKQKLSKESPIVKIGTYEGALSIVNQRFNQNLELFNQAKQAGDEQAMAELQPLLQIDSQKAEGLKKGIEAQKFEAEYKEPNTVGNVLDIGFQKAIGGMQAGANTIDETMNAINRDLWGLIGVAPSAKFEQELKDFNEKNKDKIKRPSDYIAETGKKILEEANKRGQEKNINLQYNGSAWEALKGGDASKFGEYAAKGFLESLPSSLTFLNPYTATATSLGMAQEEIDQSIKEKGSFDTIDAGVGFAKAGLEFWTERWMGAGKGLKDLVSSLGREGAERALTEGLEQTVKKSLKKKLGRGMIEEPTGEGLNQFASNLLDKYVQGKDISVWQGVPDATIIGMFGGMTQGNLSTTANHYLDKAKYNNAQKMREEAASLTDQAMDQPNEVAKQALEEKAAEVQAKAEEIEQKESELALNASTESVDAIIEVETKIDEIVVALETATPETAPILEEKLEQLEEERVVLVEEATLEAEESIKALESLKEDTNETINEEVNTQPMLEGVQSSRNENEGSKESPELRTDKTKEEEIVVAKEENVPLIDEVNNTEVVEPQDQKRSEKVDFTEAESLNTIYSNLKSKYGDKKGNSIYEAAIRLVNPNKNTIVEIRGNGVVVKEGEKYILKPFSNTDSNSKKWVLGTGLDVSAQFIKEQPQVETETTTNKQQEDAIK